jgi:hypothetical protein
MAKITGKGSKFEINTAGSPPTWVSVGQVREIGGATVTSEEVDVTTIDDNISGLPSDYKDFIGGFKDPGELSVTVIFDPNLTGHGSGANGLWGIFDRSQTIQARVMYPTSPPQYLTMSGFFRDWETPTINATDPIESTFTFRIRQKPNLALT